MDYKSFANGANRLVIYRGDLKNEVRLIKSEDVLTCQVSMHT